MQCSVGHVVTNGMNMALRKKALDRKGKKDKGDKDQPGRDNLPAEAVPCLCYPAHFYASPQDSVTVTQPPGSVIPGPVSIFVINAQAIDRYSNFVTEVTMGV
jgi:hypothetical protein